MAHERSPVIVAMADGRVVDAMEGMDGLGQLIVRTARDGDRVLVEIGDNSPSIPEPAAAHVLEPFCTHQAGRQGHRPWARICWRIVVRRHHGDLGFTSAPATPVCRCWCLFIQKG